MLGLPLFANSTHTHLRAGWPLIRRNMNSTLSVAVHCANNMLVCCCCVIGVVVVCADVVPFVLSGTCKGSRSWIPQIAISTRVRSFVILSNNNRLLWRQKRHTFLILARTHRLHGTPALRAAMRWDFAVKFMVLLLGQFGGEKRRNWETYDRRRK